VFVVVYDDDMQLLASFTQGRLNRKSAELNREMVSGALLQAAVLLNTPTLEVSGTFQPQDQGGP
jgi:hypothetical protein